jgi:hypothetical protein
VKGWSAVFSALLFFIPAAARAADDLGSAARDLARKTAASVGRNELVSVEWRNAASSLASPELSAARSAFEAALTQAGVRLVETAPGAQARMTLSENQSQYLLVEELRKGDDRQVWIAAWKRTDPLAPPTPAANLEKKLIWKQEDQMLDVAFPSGGMLVLTRSNLTLFAQTDGHWQPKASVPLNPPKPWPRDPRGRLRIHGTAFEAYLPGAICDGILEPLSVECRASDEPWVLESGSRAMLLATFAATRNYFDGRVIIQTGQRKTAPPFYSAASVEEQGRPVWLLAQVDGKTQIFDGAFEPAGSLAGWGSDIAGVDARCAGGSAVLATRPGDGTTPDALQPFSLANRDPVPLAEGAELPGPVLALWPAGGPAAVAIVRNLATGKYEAYLFTVVCA